MEVESTMALKRKVEEYCAELMEDGTGSVDNIQGTMAGPPIN